MSAGLGSRVRRWQAPRHLGPTVFLAMTGFFVAVVVWGWMNPMDVRVEYFDAGSARSFAIGEVTAFPEQDLYIVGLQDGRLRAIDGRIEGTSCRVTWKPDDSRGQVRNPGGVPGVFEDPCTGAIWSIEANAIEGSSQPLRTPHIDYRPGPDGSTIHAFVERVNP